MNENYNHAKRQKVVLSHYPKYVLQRKYEVPRSTKTKTTMERCMAITQRTYTANPMNTYNRIMIIGIYPQWLNI